MRLEHPRGAEAGAPDLQLCSDGMVIGLGNIKPLNTKHGDPADTIYADDEDDWRIFEAFVRAIPSPTAWQSFNAMTVWELKMHLIFIAIVGAITLAALAVLRAFGILR
jgi:hypothetical protein